MRPEGENSFSDQEIGSNATVLDSRFIPPPHFHIHTQIPTAPEGGTPINPINFPQFPTPIDFHKIPKTHPSRP